MINYRAEIAQSWVLAEPSARSLAALLGLGTPVGLREIIDRLHVVEEISLSNNINTADSTPINGHVAFVLRSDGSSVFSGHVRATGFPSYDFAVQSWVTTTDGSVVAAQKRGSVYGTDTPGDEQVNWNQQHTNGGIRAHWRSLRANANLHYKLHAESGGVLGSALDVLEFVVKGLIANAVIGPQGWVILIGDELIGIDTQLGAPGTLAGVLVGGTTLLIMGPAGLVPAIVAGAATVSIMDVDHRPMDVEDIKLARSVFGDSIDYSRILLTNMTHPTEPGRKFAFPSLGKTIMLNLGDAAFNDPRGYTDPANGYNLPGQVFIHELMHAWQYTHHSLFEMLCNYSENYDYFDTARDRIADNSWHGRAWNGFKVEQQAHIVDDWFEAFATAPDGGLGSFDALNDPAYRFVRDEIRSQVP